MIPRTCKDHPLIVMCSSDEQDAHDAVHAWDEKRRRFAHDPNEPQESIDAERESLEAQEPGRFWAEVSDSVTGMRVGAAGSNPLTALDRVRLTLTTPHLVMTGEIAEPDPWGGE